MPALYGLFAVSLIVFGASRSLLTDHPVAAYVGAIVSGLGLAVVAVLDSRWAGPAPSGAAVRLEAAAVAVGAGVLLVVAKIYVFSLTDGWEFAGAIAALFGVWHFVLEFRHWCRDHLRIAAAVAGSGVILSMVGVAALPMNGVAGIALAVGVVLVVVGWDVSSAPVLHLLETRPPSLALVPAGVVLVVIGGLVLIRFHLAPPAWTIDAVIALFLFALAVTSDTVVDVLVVIVAVALLWAFAPRDVAAPSAMNPGSGAPVVAVFGDSIPSGEGATGFVTGTNTRGANTCRRAATAWSVLLAERADGPVSGVPDAAKGVPDKIATVACSGASTLNLTTTRQHPGEPLGYPDGHPIPDFSDGLPQIRGYDWLWQHQSAPKPFVPKIVFVTIGANDAGFGDIGQTCVEPGDCSQIGQLFLDQLEDVGTKDLLPAYDEIRKEFGGKAPIVVVPYAVPISDKPCRYSPLSADEHKFLNRYALELDRMIQRDAKAEGFYYVDNMPGALTGERICDTSPRNAGVNFVAANPVDGTAEETINPSNWFHNSLHPNERGHQALARAIVTWINGQGGLPLQPSPTTRPSSQPAAYKTPTLEQIMGSGFRSCRQPDAKLRPSLCASSRERWTNLHLRVMLASIALPLLSVLVGSWTVWLVAIQRLRSRRRAPQRA